ncbi:MAG: hypothetical protein JWQ38_3161 [Flavipsychrobacter sp.]|nr:hypothetical protein [Flavipsychrobacter sp.]
MKTASLPSLDLAAWEQSKTTLNLYLQVVGKIQLALMPRKNHWWNITFLVNAKGLITHTMPANDFTFDIQFNFLEHKVELVTSKGIHESFPLTDGLSVADLYKKMFTILDKLNIQARIIPHPYGMPDANPMTTPFEQLTDYNSYNAEYVQKFWRILMWTCEVFTEFSGRFYGKTSPVQLFWHHMDLVVTRFCGRRAPAMSPEANISNKDAYSHELISFGFWAGDENVRGAAFYSYTYPSPGGLDKEPLAPRAAKWQLSNGSPMALLMYDDLRSFADPHKDLLDFLESCYMAGATLSGWDVADLKVVPLKEI